MSDSILDRIVTSTRARVAEKSRGIDLGLLRQMAESRQDMRDFEGAVAGSGIRIVAEIKRASPSAGWISRDADVVGIATAYEAGGACALSVLTEPEFFKAAPHDFGKVRMASSLPVLRKDFILTPFQVMESAAMGADAILLIARILTEAELLELAELARSFGLGILFEIHGEEEIGKLSAANPTLVGINNRNLATFETNLAVAGRVAKRLPETVTPMALSGVKTKADIETSLETGISRFLVGEHLMRATDPGTEMAHLLSAGEAS